MSEHTNPHVVVVGAGYAGAHAARAALDEGAEVTVVDDTGRHDFAPRLAGVAGGGSGLGDAWAEVGELLDVRVVQGAVTAVDHAHRAVAVHTGVDVTYGALVLTVGAETVVPDLPGTASGMLSLRTAEDAVALRAALGDAPALVVIGGGTTGVQLAGEAAVAHPDLPIHVVERRARLLPELGWLLGKRAARILRGRGVELHLDSEVAAVHDDRVVLRDGPELTGMVVWATGVAASGNRLLPDASTRDGRLVVDEHLRVPGHDRVFAAGDVALHRDPLGRRLPMSAQVARQAGRVAGRNAARVATAAAAGRDPADLRTARLVDWGRVVDLGGGSGVAQVGPVPFALPLADRVVPLLHDVVDLRHLFEVGGVHGVMGHAPGRHAPAAIPPAVSTGRGRAPVA